jgi:hypothetical protein
MMRKQTQSMLQRWMHRWHRRPEHTHIIRSVDDAPFLVVWKVNIPAPRRCSSSAPSLARTLGSAALGARGDTNAAACDLRAHTARGESSCSCLRFMLVQPGPGTRDVYARGACV